MALTSAIALYAAFATGALQPSTPHARSVLAHSLVGRTPLFLLGIAAAALYRSHGTWLRERAASIPWLRSGGADFLLFVVVYALGRLLRYILHFNYEVLEATWPIWHLFEGVLWFFVLLLLLLAPVRLKPLIVNSFSTTVGLLSYSIYMVHLPLILVTVPWVRGVWPEAVSGWNASSILVCAAIAGAALALSTVTYLCIERPMLARKARIGDDRT